MKLYLKVMGCSCYTCLPRTAPAAAQIGQKAAVPGTGRNAKTSPHIHIHTNKSKN